MKQNFTRLHHLLSGNPHFRMEMPPTDPFSRCSDSKTPLQWYVLYWPTSSHQSSSKGILQKSRLTHRSAAVLIATPFRSTTNSIVPSAVQYSTISLHSLSVNCQSVLLGAKPLAGETHCRKRGPSYSIGISKLRSCTQIGTRAKRRRIVPPDPAACQLPSTPAKIGSAEQWARCLRLHFLKGLVNIL